MAAGWGAGSSRARWWLSETVRLAGLPSTALFVAEASRLIADVIAAEDVLWMDTDFSAARFLVWSLRLGSRQERAEEVMSDLFWHPAIQSYLRSPVDLSARRLTDLREPYDDAQATALRLSQDALGRHQLSMIVEVDMRGRGAGWVLTRQRPPFTSREVEQADYLLPSLVALARMHLARQETARRAVAEATVGTVLTPREREVVALLSRGLTARAMGHALGISQRTVDKHLEHIYAKLDRHDRLVVVRDLGAYDSVSAESKTRYGTQ